MKNVIIIGGGPAGLTAGYELLKDNDDIKVTILEESKSLGGKSQTVRYHGNRMDIGGHRFFSKDDTIMKWWSDILPVNHLMMTRCLAEKKSLQKAVLTLKRKMR